MIDPSATATATPAVAPAATAATAPVRRAQVWSPATLARLTPTALIGAVLTMVQMQVVAFPARNPLTEPLSVYVHSSGGWLFPIGLVLLGIGMLSAAAAVGLALPRNRAAAGLLGLGGLGSVVAATFPADSASGGMSWVGEAHRYASLALLVMPLFAGLFVARSIRPIEPKAARRLSLVVWAATAFGVLFLLGFLPNLMPDSDWAGLAVLSAVSGASQRLMVAFVIVAVAMMAKAALRAAPQNAPAPVAVQFS